MSTTLSEQAETYLNTITLPRDRGRARLALQRLIELDGAARTRAELLETAAASGRFLIERSVRDHAAEERLRLRVRILASAAPANPHHPEARELADLQERLRKGVTRKEAILPLTDGCFVTGSNLGAEAVAYGCYLRDRSAATVKP